MKTKATIKTRICIDTVEELNGTYFYAGKSNLVASELLFMIFCENTASQFGIGAADFGAVVALVSGRNNLWTRAKPINATKGTSYASKAARVIFKKAKFPFGISLPTWLGGYTPWTTRRVMVRNIAPFVGRSCSGQQKLATALEFFQNNLSDSFGVKPPLY